MKKTIIMAIAAAFLFISCEKNDQVDKTKPMGGQTGTGTGTSTNTTPSVGFSYIITAPLILECYNTSTGMKSYKWDFGNGTWAYTTNATCTYSTAGTYIVTLTGTDASGNKYDCRKSIKIKDPVIKIKGYTLHKIPYENKYYKVVCKDDDWLKTNWGFTTVYTPLLDNTDIPYTSIFNPSKEMTNLSGDNYYTFYVKYTNNTSNTSGDNTCLSVQLKKTEIMKYKDEHILTSSDGKTKLGILMEYD